MNGQADLLDLIGDPAADASPAAAAQYRAFVAFRDANPTLLPTLVRMARQRRADGMERVGIGELFEELRWFGRRATEGSAFKMPNTLRAWFVREIEQRHPDLGGFFERRKSLADEIDWKKATA